MRDRRDDARKRGAIVNTPSISGLGGDGEREDQRNGNYPT